MDTLISNVTVVTMNERMDVLFGAYIGIAEGKISCISTTAPSEQPQTIIDGTGMVAIPGLVNCHTHLATTALRGYFDELSARDALERLLQIEAKMDFRCAKAAATLGVAECLRFGITSVSDLYYFPEATAQVAADAGIKANIALSAYRFEDENEEFDAASDAQCQELNRLYHKWHGFDDGRIGRIHGQQRRAEQAGKKTQHSAGNDRPDHAGLDGGENAARLARTDILAAETGDGLMKRVHRLINKAAHVCCGGVAGNHDGAEAVDGGLDDHV